MPNRPPRNKPDSITAEKKVNVSILDEEETSIVKAVSPVSESEETALTSSVLYGEERARPALGDFLRKKALR